MNFCKLRLTGFKSFVDSTEFLILPGLTGVVGPNGCGKSNLLEALRWVMGESRPTALRGGGMEEVIFDGAGTRPAKNYAEVTLILEDPKVFNDYQSETMKTIEVVRRVTRAIGSSFKLEGREARLRDIQMLFADASTGAQSPSLVRQGQISELINANPKSRRGILEEAAGISGLYQRRQEAELKLRSAEANVQKVQDVLSHLDNQLQSLSKQAYQAKRYKKLAAELREMQAFLIYKKWQDAANNLIAVKNEMVENTKKLSLKTRHAAEAQKVRENSEKALPGLREKEAISAATLSRLQVEKDNLKEQEDRAIRVISDLKLRKKQVFEDRQREENLVKDAGDVVDRLNIEFINLEKMMVKDDQILIDSKKLESNSLQNLTNVETELEELSLKVAEFNAKKQTNLTQISETLRLIKGLEGLQTEGKDIADDLKRQKVITKKRLEVSKKKFESHKSLADTIKADFQKAQNRREELTVLETSQLKLFSSLQSKFKTVESEVDTLNQLIKSTDDQKNQIIHNVEIEDGYELAFAAAVSDDVKVAVINKNDQTGWYKLPSYKKKNELPNGSNLLLDKVMAPEVLRRRLSNTAVVEFEEGVTLQFSLKEGQRLVSKKGDLWRWDGYCLSGKDLSSETSIVLKHKKRLKKLVRDFELIKEETIKSSEAYLKTKKSLTEHKWNEDKIREERENSDSQILISAQEISSNQVELVSINKKLQDVQEANITNELEIKRLNLRKAELEDEQINDVTLEDLRASLIDKKSAVEKARTKMISQRTFVEQIERESEDRKKRLVAIKKELLSWDNRLSFATDRLTECAKRENDLKNKLEEAEDKPTNILGTRNNLSQLIVTAQKEKDTSTESRSKMESAVRTGAQLERNMEREASEARESAARIEVVQSSAEILLKSLENQFFEEMGTKIEDFDEAETKVGRELCSLLQIEEKLESLKRKKDYLGAVNLRAEQDSKEISDEFELLRAEKDDLDEAISKLRSGISNLNKEGRDRLLDAFDKVNKNFAKLFSYLFDGGEAILTLIDSDDPLESGLEIKCQPPGKKLSNLSLLSGGEQTLAALSLILAVFLANPSPVCVLDEVDAPLDDANVYRFCNLLEQMTTQTKTKFLIITHHALTMAKMDRLYGVTMVEKGVSKLVSVDLKSAEKLVD